MDLETDLSRIFDSFAHGMFNNFDESVQLELLEEHLPINTPILIDDVYLKDLSFMDDTRSGRISGYVKINKENGDFDNYCVSINKDFNYRSYRHLESEYPNNSIHPGLVTYDLKTIRDNKINSIIKS